MGLAVPYQSTVGMELGLEKDQRTETHGDMRTGDIRKHGWDKRTRDMRTGGRRTSQDERQM